MLVEFECPQCKGHLCERWGLQSPSAKIRLMYWFHMLNPVMSINELALGQRSPVESFICKSCDLPLVDRAYVHCSNCNQFHLGRLWSYRLAFGNWLGCVCPTCAAPIPCLWNLTSRLLLAMTAPFWYLPVKHNKARWLRRRQKEMQQAQLALIENQSLAAKPIDWRRIGWTYGFWMFFAFTFVFPAAFLLAIGRFTWPHLFGTTIATATLGIIIWPLSGWLFGKCMQLVLDKKGDRNLHLTFDEEGAPIPAVKPPDLN